MAHGSHLACAAALLCQLFEVCRRVELQDWAALLDTAGAVAAIVLTAGTCGLNLLAVVLHSRRS